MNSAPADDFDYDSILVVGFGGPEGPRDVMPFLENVTRGRNVPRERLLEVAEHYHHFGGKSPINDQARALISALETELRTREIDLPIYWGNRNWHPFLADTLRSMRDHGRRRTIGFVLSAYSSYSSCRQYLDNIEQARALVGAGAPIVEKLRAFYNHPEFIAANAERVRDAISRVLPANRSLARLAFTAHSIPKTMADRCDYEAQVTETCRLVAERVGLSRDRWRLVYQSRSGRPSDPWLEPDILDHLRSLASQSVPSVVIHPVGFLSDHLEVLYDLDVEARDVCQTLGLEMIRAATVGVHPAFVGMIRELIDERLDPAIPQRAIGCFGPSHDRCAVDCCRPGK